MNLLDLLSWRRYRRCRRVFSSPLGAHVLTASGSRKPANLKLASGGVLSLPRIRNARRLLRWLLSEAENPLPVTAQEDTLVFKHGPRRIALRPLDTDFYTFQEVVLRDGYGVQRLAEPLGTVVDIGANIGFFTLCAAPFADRVVCVEPVEENLRIARRNIELADLTDKVAFHQCAIAGQSGSVRLFLSAWNHGGHSICSEHAIRWGQTRHVDVPAITLADLFERGNIQHCSLLKCDVEGAEFGILAGAPRELLAGVDRIVMEVHLTQPEWNQREFQSLADKLRSAGHRVEHEPLHESHGRLKPVISLAASRQF